MATSDPRQTEGGQSSADEKWVLLPHDGDAANEQESSQNAALLSWSAEDTEKFLCWSRSAWNDVLIRKNLWDYIRAYALGVALSGNTVLRLLTALASLAEWNTLRLLLTSLGHFTMTVLCAAVFSYAARFTSLLAAKTSAVKKLEANVLLLGLLMTNLVMLMAARVACPYELNAGHKLFQEEFRQEDLVWYLKHFAGTAMLKASIVPWLLAQSQLVSMLADVCATLRTFVLHLRETKEAWKLAIWRWLKRQFLELKSRLLEVLYIAIVCVVLECIFCILSSIGGEPTALLGQAAPAASGDI